MSAKTFSRLCVSSTGGSGGKTLLALGLGRAIAGRGIIVAPFKKGPDYIDAAWLALACGRAAVNLDLFFLETPQLRSLFSDALLKEAAINPGREIFGLIEGNRGLYDGLDENGSCSTAALARALHAPILLSINVTRSTRTVAAILQGLVSFEKGLDFIGVVLNRAGTSRHENAVRRAIEANTDLRVLGALPRLDKNPFPERHMGLPSAYGDADPEVEKKLDSLAELVEKNCNVSDIIELAAPKPVWENARSAVNLMPLRARPPRIGYVLDKALWFYYGDNLDALRKAGANLIRLSLLEDNPEAWNNLDGLYLGGGFPEDFAQDIARSPNLEKIALLGDMGMPIYAECGGLLILGKGLKRDGKFSPMAGIFDFIAEFTLRPRGLGYVCGEIVEENPFFPLGTVFRGHEFHYTCCRLGKSSLGLRLERGTGLKSVDGRAMDGLVHKNIWASYAHMFAPAMPCWAENFVKAATNWRKN